jgi:prepilin-type processing-associated H-X9-DG protein
VNSSSNQPPSPPSTQGTQPPAGPIWGLGFSAAANGLLSQLLQGGVVDQLVGSGASPSASETLANAWPHSAGFVVVGATGLVTRHGGKYIVSSFLDGHVEMVEGWQIQGKPTATGTAVASKVWLNPASIYGNAGGTGTADAYLVLVLAVQVDQDFPAQGIGRDGARADHAVFRPRPLDDAAETDQRDLRRVDHTEDGLHALVAEVGDRDRGVRDLGAAQHAGPRALHEVGEFGHQQHERLGLDVVLAPGLDTDRFGTFTREVARAEAACRREAAQLESVPRERLASLAPGTSSARFEQSLDVLFGFDFTYRGNHNQLIADALGVPRRAVRIAAGLSARQKLVDVDGIEIGRAHV